MGYEIHIELTGQIRLPVACQLCVGNKPEEDASESCDERERAYGTPPPPLSGRRCLPWKQSQLQGVLRWTSSKVLKMPVIKVIPCSLRLEYLPARRVEVSEMGQT